MDVIVDGESNYSLKGEPADAISAVGAVSEYLRAQGRSILSVKVDGAEVRPEDLAARLKDLPASAVGKIEIGSERVATLVDDCLKGLVSLVPELPNVCRSLAQVFQGERPEEGFDPFVELAEFWSQIKSREAMVTNALELDVAALKVGGKSIESIHAELNQFLEEAEQALKDGDMILLGDLLEYELAPRAEQEVEIVSLLQAQLPANSG